MASPDWLRHALTISGPAAEVARFRTAAAGPGSIPWFTPDLDFEEDDRFLALVDPPDGSRGLSPEAARILARELREAVFQHQAKVRAQQGVNRLCPFDLHQLVPVSAEVLERGPGHPISIAWLRAHWGTVQALRQVRVISVQPSPKQRKAVALNLEFWSSDWTPWAALQTLRQNWPMLKLTVRPEYGGR